MQSDTFDAVLALHNARDILGSQDTNPVCIFNLANAYTPGGGWLNGAMAQEEELCYRSTLSDTLIWSLYPMGELDCIYSPAVVIFRENFERGHTFMWTDKPDLVPIVSVISMAAKSHPKLDNSVKPSKYHNPTDCTTTKDKMRAVLRVAAHNGNRRLVLGALGCGVFKHPNQEVADCWAEVFQETEFKGWFEMIVFAILDKQAAPGGNFAVFQQTLESLVL